jgi:hypothetical protein
MVLIGPSGSVPVKISSIGLEEIELDQRDVATAQPALLASAINITDNGAIVFRDDSQPFASVDNAKKFASFIDDATISLNSFTIYTVTLTAEIDNVPLHGIEAIDYSAFVDPQFIIGGDDRSAYSLAGR